MNYHYSSLVLVDVVHDLDTPRGSIAVTFLLQESEKDVYELTTTPVKLKSTWFAKSGFSLDIMFTAHR